MANLSCEKCKTILTGTAGGSGLGMLISRFPDQLPESYLHLAAGPSALPCSVCGHITHFPTAQLVCGPNDRAVLYLPDDVTAPDPFGEAAVLGAIARSREPLGMDGVDVTRDRRRFRRAFLQAFVIPSADLANDYSFLAGSPMEWVQRHEANLDAVFFSAQWLLASGAVPSFQSSPSGGRPASSFVPHEEAHSDANHLVKRRLVETSVAERCGEILGCLLSLWAERSITERSFSGWLEAAPKLMPAPALSGVVCAAAAERIKKHVELFTLGERGAILWRYVFEATLAILCDAHCEPNPRATPWTQILLLYEFHRRGDGNDESMLLPPELVRRSLNEPEFWRGVRAIGRSLGPLTSETAPAHDHLIETVHRLFPENAQDFLRIEINFAEDGKGSELQDRLPGLIERAFQSLPDPMMLRGVLAGLQRHHPDLLDVAVESIRHRFDVAGADAGRQLSVWRHVIETLNLARRFAASAAVGAEVRALLAADAEAGGTMLRAQLLNELGNCHRYAGEFERALECYEDSLELWSRDANDRDTRVVLRNRAIVLRSLHRYAEAREGFAGLRPLAHDAELLGLVNSEALCLAQMGETDGALVLLDAHAALLANASLRDTEANSAALLRAELMAGQGRRAEAREVADRVAAAGASVHDPITIALAAKVLLDTLDDDLPENERTPRRQTAIAALEGAVAEARVLVGVPDMLVGIVVTLNDALVEDGRATDGEALLRDVLQEARVSASTNTWLLALQASYHAVRRKDVRQATRDLVDALQLLSMALWRVALEGDPVALLAPNARAVTALTHIILHKLAPASPAGRAGLHIAADLRSAPMLTPRLRQAAGLPPAVADMAQEAVRLGQTLRETPCTVLQAISLGDEIAVFLTPWDANSETNPQLRPLGINPKQAASIANRLAYAISRMPPNAQALELERVLGWPDLRQALRDAVADLPTEEPLCIVPGPLSSTVFSLAFGDSQAVCFVPSLGALTALRARRRALPGGLSWRPASMFGFATWFASEAAAQAAALTQGVDAAARLAAGYGLSFESSVGVEATGQSLLEGLTAADLACIACHGRILPEAEAVDLIVAANGRLPPGDLSQLLDAHRAPHVLGWRQMAKLKSAASVILSSACNSGLTVLHQGGERLGLERSLFQAGTLAYVAPQWPVPTVASQDLTLAILQDWLAAPGRSLMAVVARQRQAALQAGVSPLVGCAFAVFGDGL